MPSIDTATVQALVEARVISNLGSDLSYVPMAESPGEGLGAWCQIVAVDPAPVWHQQADGEVDGLAVVVTAQVGVARTKASAHALAGALEILRRALDRQTIDDSAESGHVIRLDRAEARQDPAAFEARDARTGAVQVQGWAQRASGTSRADFLG